MEVQINLAEFERALDKAIFYSSRDVSEVINAACLDIIINSAKAMPTADKEKMQHQLQDTISAVSKKTGKQYSRRHPSRLIYNIVNARLAKKGGAGLAGQEMKVAASKIIKARLASIGYVAYAGFQNANLAFGGKGFGNKQKKAMNPSSQAAKGYGTPANRRSLWAEFTNTAKMAYEIGGGIVQMIVDFKTIDMEEHLEAKLGRSFKSL
jgi:hypothetical protein